MHEHVLSKKKQKIIKLVLKALLSKGSRATLIEGLDLLVPGLGSVINLLSTLKESQEFADIAKQLLEK